MAIARKGTDSDDVLRSRGDDDLANGLKGDDCLVDGGRYNQRDPDAFEGSLGDDCIFAHWGADRLSGGAGADFMISRSDAGEPMIAQDPLLPKVNANEPLLAADDVLNGGIGWDTFYFKLDLNSTRETIARFTDKTGTVDWEALHEEAGGPHHHWVESIGNDRIEDFYRGEGDRIVIDGHRVTVAIAYEDETGDGRIDTSVITLTSDPAVIGAHTGDALGTIRVRGDLVTMEDINFAEGDGHHEGMRGAVGDISELLRWSKTAASAEDDLLRGAGAEEGDELAGLRGDDTMVDATREGGTAVDSFQGGDGNDRIYTQWGRDVVNGGDGDDIIVSRSDAGEPVIAQETTREKVEPGEPYLEADDRFTGGLGADTFVFRFDVDAKLRIIAEHMEADGSIDWHGVTGENRRVHDHWVEAFGTDTITDFYRAEGDRIEIYAHTGQVYKILYRDTDGDRRADMSVILLRSNQGTSGAHHLDLLGQINVRGDLVRWDDLMVDSGIVHGVGSSIDDIGVA